MRKLKERSLNIVFAHSFTSGGSGSGIQWVTAHESPSQKHGGLSLPSHLA
jgi:hypothetical protein